MTTATDIGTMIAWTPGIHGGRPHIAGTGVTVQRIAGWHKMGFVPEEIVAKYDHLSLAQIHAALAYYHANREEIETYLATEEADYDRLSREHYQNQRRVA